MMRFRYKNKGFTLIELLVVISIMGLLASIILVSIAHARLNARDTKRVADIKAVQIALELYFADNGAYPAMGNWINYSYAGGWGTLATALSPYISSLPETSSTYPYVYIHSNPSRPNACYTLMIGTLVPMDPNPPQIKFPIDSFALFTWLENPNSQISNGGGSNFKDFEVLGGNYQIGDWGSLGCTYTGQ